MPQIFDGYEIMRDAATKRPHMMKSAIFGAVKCKFVDITLTKGGIG